MRISEVAEKTGLESLNAYEDADLSGVYISDMVSDIITGAGTDAPWSRCRRTRASSQPRISWTRRWWSSPRQAAGRRCGRARRQGGHRALLLPRRHVDVRRQALRPRHEVGGTVAAVRTSPTTHRTRGARSPAESWPDIARGSDGSRSDLVPLLQRTQAAYGYLPPRPYPESLASQAHRERRLRRRDVLLPVPLHAAGSSSDARVPGHRLPRPGWRADDGNARSGARDRRRRDDARRRVRPGASGLSSGCCASRRFHAGRGHLRPDERPQAAGDPRCPRRDA